MNKEEWIKNVIIVSGGFDTVHKGHIRMFREAANLGAQVIVGLNSDEWLSRKKGKSFMEWDERAEILESCKFVNQVIPFDDSDDTASDVIFKVCKELDVTMLWGVGGGKIQSSSWLINGDKK